MCTPSRGDIDPGEQESNPWNIEREKDAVASCSIIFVSRYIYIPHSLDGYVYIDYTVIVCSLHFYFFSYIQDPAIIIVQSLATDKEGPENVTKKRKKESKKL